MISHFSEEEESCKAVQEFSSNQGCQLSPNQSCQQFSAEDITAKKAFFLERVCSSSSASIGGQRARISFTESSDLSTDKEDQKEEIKVIFIGFHGFNND